MLVLGRKVNESIRVEGPCTITLLRASDGRARVGIEADKTVPIIRTEVLERKREQAKAIAEVQLVNEGIVSDTRDAQRKIPGRG